LIKTKIIGGPGHYRSVHDVYRWSVYINNLLYEQNGKKKSRRCPYWPGWCAEACPGSFLMKSIMLAFYLNIWNFRGTLEGTSWHLNLKICLATLKILLKVPLSPNACTLLGTTYATCVHTVHTLVFQDCLSYCLAIYYINNVLSKNTNLLIVFIIFPSNSGHDRLITDTDRDLIEIIIFQKQNKKKCQPSNSNLSTCPQHLTITNHIFLLSTCITNGKPNSGADLLEQNATRA